MDGVLNWLVQGGLVALATGGLLRVVDGSHTRARYAALWVALISVLVLPVVPLVWSVAPARVDGVPALDVPMVAIPSAWWMSARVAFALWIVWAAAGAVRVGRAAGALRRAKRQLHAVPDGIEGRLRWWSHISARGRRARLVLSTSIRSAAVLGCTAPVIAIAPRLLDQLSDEELDRIVVHEWAHVQRRDDIANVIQLLAEIVAGWHPAVWWVNRQLRHEREVACDDVAVAITGSAKAYATCLVKLACLPRIAVPSLPVVAAVTPSDLRRRVVRILSPRQVIRSQSYGAVAAAAGVALAAIACAVGSLRFVEVEAEAAAVAAAVTQAAHEISAATADPINAGVGVLASSSDRAVVAARPSSIGARPLRGPIAPSSEIRIRSAEQAAPAPANETQAPRASAAPPSPESAQPLRSTALPPAWTGVGAAGTASADGRSEAVAATPWGAAADTGVVVARGSQKAAVATADFFTRVGKKIAGSF